jgi:integrase
VGDQLLDTLRGLVREQFGTTAALPDAPMFTTPERVLIDPDNLRHRIWMPALSRAKLRHVVIHSLKHTFASLLISQGENPKYIQTQLGHSGIKLTMDTVGTCSRERSDRQPRALRGNYLQHASRLHPTRHFRNEGDHVEVRVDADQLAPSGALHQ